MAQNYFEDYSKTAQEKLARDREIAREEAAQLAARIALAKAKKQERIRTSKQLNEERLVNRAGDKPGDLWGPEAAALCEEFLDFAKGTSLTTKRHLVASAIVRSTQVGTKGLRRKPVYETTTIAPTWSIDGYAIAYFDITGMGKPSTRISGSLSPSAAEKDQFLPRRDTFLCTDGLVRVGTEPLPIDPLKLSAYAPKIGYWHVSVRQTGHNVFYDDRGEIRTGENFNFEYQPRFTEATDTAAAIKSVLEAHASAVSTRQG